MQLDTLENALKHIKYSRLSALYPRFEGTEKAVLENEATCLNTTTIIL